MSTPAGRAGNTTSNDELYEYFLRPLLEYRDSGLSLDTFPKQSFTFEVRGARNLFIALCQYKETYVAEQMYGFQLGGAIGTRSVLRKNSFEYGTELSASTTYGILDEFSFKSFWVSWNDGKFRLGQGTLVGKDVVLSYKDEKAFKPKFLSFSAYDVPVTVIVHKESPSPSDLLQVTVPNYYQYYDASLRMDLSTSKYLLLEIKAAKNVFVALTQYKDVYEMDRMYEVLIGANENTKTTLRNAIPVLADANTPGILEANTFRPFWLSWANGKIRFGKGSVVGEQTVVEYTDANPIPIYHLAVSGWDVNGSIKIHREQLSVGDSVKDGTHRTFTYHDTGLQLSQSTTKTVVVRCMASRSLFLSFSQHKEWFETGKVYEVLVGGWTNTSSTLRKNKFEGLPLFQTASTSGILDNRSLRPFWFTWKDGNLKFGKGDVPGQDVVLQYTDPSPMIVNWFSVGGWDVPGNILLTRELTPPDIIQFSVPNRYEYWNVPGLNLAHRNSIVFDIMAKQNVFVALCSYRFTYEANRMYNFLIGTTANTYSSMRKNLHGVGLELVNAQTPNIFDEFKFVTLWFSWSNGRVQFGKGSVVGQNSILNYEDPDPIPIRHLAFAGYDNPATVLIRRGVYEVAMNNNYTYTDTGLTLSTCNSLVFYLKASTDAYLALTSTKNNYDGKIYEIVFGAFGNTCTLIRISKQDDMVASSSSPNVLDGDTFRPFWVSWANGNILAGKGAVVGEHILAAYDEYSTPVAVNYLGVTGFNEAGVFRVE